MVIAWIGVLKYTSSEAMRIQQYIQNSPLTSWLDGVLNAHLLSAMLGTVEILAALLVALSPWAPRLSALGSAIATLLFITTLSFLFTTPGVGDSAAGGFPALSPVGQFLLKDIVLVRASIWTLGESLLADVGIRSSPAPDERPARRREAKVVFTLRKLQSCVGHPTRASMPPTEMSTDTTPWGKE